GVGVNRGHVFAGEIGTPFRATYTVMGDTVNLAARLMAAASASEVYASPSVLDRARTRFETTALEPFAVKGKSEPVHAFAVGVELGARTEVVTDSLPFSGREAELAALQDLLQPRPSEVPQVVFVMGETGIGKTRLVAEAVAGLDDVQRVDVRAEPYATATPYRAVRDPMRELLGVERADASALTERLGAIAPELVAFAPLVADVIGVDMLSTPEVDALDPHFRRDRLAEVVFGLVERVVDRPLVWIVDDA